MTIFNVVIQETYCHPNGRKNENRSEKVRVKANVYKAANHASKCMKLESMTSKVITRNVIIEAGVLSHNAFLCLKKESIPDGHTIKNANSINLLFPKLDVVKISVR